MAIHEDTAAASTHTWKGRQPTTADDRNTPVKCADAPKMRLPRAPSCTARGHQASTGERINPLKNEFVSCKLYKDGTKRREHPRRGHHPKGGIGCGEDTHLTGEQGAPTCGPTPKSTAENHSRSYVPHKPRAVRRSHSQAVCAAGGQRGA